MDDKNIQEFVRQLRSVEPMAQHKGHARRSQRRAGSASTAPKPSCHLIMRYCAKGYGGRDTENYRNFPVMSVERK